VRVLKRERERGEEIGKREEKDSPGEKAFIEANKAPFLFPFFLPIAFVLVLVLGVCWASLKY
jgi:hypothetical protein